MNRFTISLPIPKEDAYRYTYIGLFRFESVHWPINSDLTDVLMTKREISAGFQCRTIGSAKPLVLQPPSPL